MVTPAESTASSAARIETTVARWLSVGQQRGCQSVTKDKEIRVQVVSRHLCHSRRAVTALHRRTEQAIKIRSLPSRTKKQVYKGG